MEDDLMRPLEDAIKGILGLVTRNRSEATVFTADLTQDEHDRHLQDFNSACRQLEAFFVLKQHSGNPPSDAQLRAEIEELRGAIELKKTALIRHQSVIKQCTDMVASLQAKQLANGKTAG